MATSMLLEFLTLKWDISRTIWRIEVSDGSFFCIFHALLFELNFFFNWNFPLTLHELQLTSLEKNYSLVTNWDYYLLDVILGGQLKLGYLIYDFWRGSGNQETPLNPPLPAFASADFQT